MLLHINLKKILLGMSSFSASIGFQVQFDQISCHSGLAIPCSLALMKISRAFIAFLFTDALRIEPRNPLISFLI